MHHLLLHGAPTIVGSGSFSSGSCNSVEIHSSLLATPVPYRQQTVTTSGCTDGGCGPLVRRWWYASTNDSAACVSELMAKCKMIAASRRGWTLSSLGCKAKADKTSSSSPPAPSLQDSAVGITMDILPSRRVHSLEREITDLQNGEVGQTRLPVRGRGGRGAKCPKGIDVGRCEEFSLG